jgi:hypothetical protein
MHRIAGDDLLNSIQCTLPKLTQVSRGLRALHQLGREKLDGSHAGSYHRCSGPRSHRFLIFLTAVSRRPETNNSLSFRQQGFIDAVSPRVGPLKLEKPGNPGTYSSSPPGRAAGGARLQEPEPGGRISKSERRSPVPERSNGVRTQVRASVGSVGDSYDNALAESINGLYKTEVIRRKGPRRSVEAVELATLDWVHWFNSKRLLEPLGYVPPAEFEAVYYRSQTTPMSAGLM